jgi:hypothetical protein
VRINNHNAPQHCSWHRIFLFQSGASRVNGRRYYNREMQMDVVFTDESDISFSELLEGQGTVGPSSKGSIRRLRQKSWSRTLSHQKATELKRMLFQALEKSGDNLVRPTVRVLTSNHLCSFYVHVTRLTPDAICYRLACRRIRLHA